MRTVLAYNKSHRGHLCRAHVERPERLDGVMTRIEKHPTWRSVRRIEAEAASVDDLLLVHSEEHVERVQREVESGGGRLDPDTYVTADSMHAALDAVGCVLAATRDVVDGAARTGFAAVRPPGHHATTSRSMGFCIFSNVAVAARWAQERAGVERVLIVDFDVHHGNGTQDIFYEDESVAYMSVHQSPFYPGTGMAHERGHGRAAGSTINIPMPSGTGDHAYAEIFRGILRPIALDFDPDLIFLSAGYDAHWKDLLGGMRMTTRGFGLLVRELMEWSEECCEGRLVAALEGGYHVDALAESVAATIMVMNDPDADVVDPLGSPPGEDVDVKDYLLDLKAYFST